MAIDLTGTDDESEDQAGHHPDPDQHSMPETADRAPDSEPVTPTASPAAGGFSNEDWQWNSHLRGRPDWSELADVIKVFTLQRAAATGSSGQE